MKVAIVSPVPMYPLNAGNRSRILNLTRALRSLGHDVHFIYLDSSQKGGVDLRAHADEMGKTRFAVIRRNSVQLWFYRATRVGRLLLRGLGRILRSRHAWYNGLDELYSQTFSAQLRRIYRRSKFEAVIVEYVFYSKALDVFPDSVLKILDTHDIFADRHIPFLNSGEPTQYMFSLPAAREAFGLARAHVVIAIQREEGNALLARIGEDGPKVEVLSHLLDLSATVDCSRNNSATFIGTDNHPNRQAINIFIRDVLPLIVAKCPDFRLHLVGSISHAVAENKNLIKHGIVPNPAAVFSSAPVSINPMLLGTGVNIKLLESMALGVPVVSTRTGARGMDSERKAGLVICPDNDYQAFAEAVLELTTNYPARIRAGAAAKEAALSWNAVNIEKLSNLMMDPLKLSNHFREPLCERT